MTEWLYQLLNLSLTAAVAAVIVLIARLLLKGVPKKYSYFLWSAVFLRAISPVSFSSPVSLFSLFPFQGQSGGRIALALSDYQAARLAWILGGNEETAKLAVDAAGEMQAAGAAGVQALDGVSSSAGASLGPGFDVATILFTVWLAAVAALFLYGVVSYIRLHRKVAFAVKVSENVYESDQISTAFVLGFFRPRIYLPAGLSGQEKQYVCEHEKAHLRRHDHQIKMLAWLITVVHWFNPLMWLAFVLMVRDMEMSCDERVLEKLGEGEKGQYSNFLLALAAPRRFPSGSPLAFGESAVKTRIRNILRYRKARTWVAVPALVLVLVTFTACMSNPKGEENPDIIGGADGPTSVFLAGKLDGSSKDEDWNENVPEEYRAAFEFAEEWAEAGSGRDADRVYEMLSPALQEKAEELGIYTAENGERTMGWSSPFVTDAIDPIIQMTAGTGKAYAEITYPAMTSDPSWWVWKDYVTIEEQEKGLRVTEWTQKDFFEIASYADAAEAYEAWTPDYTEDLGGLDSFAKFLQEHHDSEGYAEYYDKYTDPVQALELTLHFAGGEAKIQSEENGEAIVSYDWPDGSAIVRMVQPVKQEESGIWVPKEISWNSEE